MFDVMPSTGGRQWEEPSTTGGSIANLHSQNSASIVAYTSAMDRAKRLAMSGGVQTYNSADAPPYSLEEKLYESKAACKITTSVVSMHLHRDWRHALFNQLDALMDPDNWDDDEPPVTAASYKTFLRLLLLKGINRRPGIGAHEGDLIASWVSERDRLTVQCKTADSIAWTVSLHDTGEPEYAAGNCSLSILMKRLSSFGPERWFDESKKIEPVKGRFKKISFETAES